ncbi:hypothetical protein PHYNN_246 [Pantoea phage Phynn]|nr:hypothetical protein PHYNN_246 [Pantoea phage Phynn]
MNRHRIMREINDLRHETAKILTDALGEWYNVRVWASNAHVADRILDRFSTPEKGMKMLRESMIELSTYYPSYLLTYALKSKEQGLQELIAYKRIDAVTTCAFPLTIKIVNDPQYDKPGIVITMRTVIPDYTASLADRNSLEINYQHPKIVFEYDGYRRVLSRLTRMITSEECPPALQVLRN